MVTMLKTASLTFEEKMMPVMAVAVLSKAGDSDIDLSLYKADVENISLDDGTIVFGLKSISEKLRNDWNATYITEEMIDRQVCEFRCNLHKYSVRGKWMLGFVADILNHFRQEFRVYAPSLNTQDRKRDASNKVLQHAGYTSVGVIEKQLDGHPAPKEFVHWRRENHIPGGIRYHHNDDKNHDDLEAES